MREELTHAGGVRARWTSDRLTDPYDTARNPAAGQSGLSFMLH
jgi:hypothetical protein